MLDHDSYPLWTSAFDPTSRFEGSWEKGSKISFTGVRDGKESGMLGIIEENRPYEFVSVAYTGLIQDGVEDTTSEIAKEWQGAHEEYTFTEENGVTTLLVNLESALENVEEFDEMWPKALEKLKEICEK